MNRIVVFLLLVLFAVVFLLSYLPDFIEKGYANAMNIAGQVGMVVCILLFFVLPGKKKPPADRA